MADRDLPLGPFRSMLFTPGHKPDWAPKAAASGTDAVIFDLEDAVPDDRKAAARMTVRSILDDRVVPASIGTYVRLNGWGTGRLLDDLLTVFSPTLDGVLLPKVAGPGDVIALDWCLSELEVRHGDDRRPVEIVPLCETAAAILDRRHVYGASPRVRRGVTGGVGSPDGDTARALGIQESPSGEETAHLLSQSVLDGRAAGLVNVFGGMSTSLDVDSVRRVARRSRRFGANGGLVIHPSHVAVVNEVYGPTPEEVAAAQAIVAAAATAESLGDGAVVVDGSMIDAAHVRSSRELLVRASAEFASPVVPVDQEGTS